MLPMESGLNQIEIDLIPLISFYDMIKNKINQEEEERKDFEDERIEETVCTICLLGFNFED